MKFAAIGVENMGFSIPVETVRYVAEYLLEYGEVPRPTLGLELEESWSAIVGLPSDDPLMVTQVLSDAAWKAGIREGMCCMPLMASASTRLWISMKF